MYNVWGMLVYLKINFKHGGSQNATLIEQIDFERV